MPQSRTRYQEPGLACRSTPLSRCLNLVSPPRCRTIADSVVLPPQSSPAVARSNAPARLACTPVRQGPRARVTIFRGCMAHLVFRLGNDKARHNAPCMLRFDRKNRSYLIEYKQLFAGKSRAQNTVLADICGTCALIATPPLVPFQRGSGFGRPPTGYRPRTSLCSPTLGAVALVVFGTPQPALRSCGTADCARGLSRMLTAPRFLLYISCDLRDRLPCSALPARRPR